jgi:Ppx/GppA phosphatase family protein
MKLTLTAFVLTAAWAGAAEPRPSSCLVAPDKQVPVKAGPGRGLYCGLDLGSRSAKLSVVSMEKGRPTTIREERICKRTLGMGALVFDAKTGTARPLPADAIGALVDTIREYEGICTRDGGTMVAAGATQWARDATNIAEVAARVNAATGVRFDVLSPTQEAEYAYVAGAVGTPGRIVLDPGSNSFELAWQEKGSATITSILVPYGYVRAAANDFDLAPDPARARAAYQEHAKAKIEQELGRLRPALSLSRLHSLVRRGKIGPEIIALGEDGAVVPLVVRGWLRDGSGGWTADQNKYDGVLNGHRTADRSFGIMTAPPLRRAEVESYLRRLPPADFKALASEPVRSLYGQKALVVPALAELLLRELGGSRLVTVPQEGTTGHILTRLRARTSQE